MPQLYYIASLLIAFFAVVVVLLGGAPYRVRKWYYQLRGDKKIPHVNELKRTEEKIRKFAPLLAIALICFAMILTILGLLSRVLSQPDKLPGISEDEAERQYLEEALQRHGN